MYHVNIIDVDGSLPARIIINSQIDMITPAGFGDFYYAGKRHTGTYILVHIVFLLPELLQASDIVNIPAVRLLSTGI